jgi:uncharacterized membrane protein YphA (DoxX/SURF4 family)
MALPIPLQVIYAGLAGSLLALIIATAQQGWKPRVFFLLALRLAIGWHFLFEGMHKIHSHLVGPVGTSKPFTSAPYFEVAEGPLGDTMRKMYLPDPEENLYALVRVDGNPQTVGELLGDDFKPTLRADMAKRGDAQNLARLAVPPVDPKVDFAPYAVDEIWTMRLNGPGGQFLGAYPLGDTLTAMEAVLIKKMPPRARERFDAMSPAVKAKAEEVKRELDSRKLPTEGITAALGKYDAAAEKSLTNTRRNYARWAAGLDATPAKKKYINGDILQTVPARLAAYEHRKQEYAALEANRSVDIGRSTLFADLAAAKAEVTSVRKGLIADADGMLDDAKGDLVKLAGLSAKEAPPEPVVASKIATLDTMTMWTITIVGACLIVGLGTRIAAVVGCGFLVMTYLAHPPFPWYAYPPGTEGNPVFVNKNAIEAVALLMIASVPSGSWLGFDGLIARIVFGPTVKTA